VPKLQPVDKYTFIKLVSVSKMVCPVKGDAGFVEEVQIVTPLKVDASFACVTALAAMSASATAPAAIFAVVIALSANSVVPIEPAAATVPVISQIVPDHVQVRAPTE
jgi:hypothetical protein